MKIKYCRNCKSKQIVKLFSLGNLSFTGKFPKKNVAIKKAPLSVVMCNKCKLVQLADKFNLRYLYGPDYGYRTGINKTMINHVKRVTEILIRKTKIKEDNLVLDIASNDGTLLNCYNKKLKTFGIDPLVNKYKKNYKNINFKVSDFFSLQKIQKHTFKKKFKIITALSVFYDLEDPNKFLKSISKILSEDGIFLLEFADLASIIRYNMFDTICHEHLEYYSTRVIKLMCKKNNLKVFDIKSNNINGASKQYYISHINSKYSTKHKIINKIDKFEKKLKLEKKETFINFIKKIDKIASHLQNKIKELKLKNKTIHCYGASTKGNVLLQYFKITNKEIPYAAERNPKKYNLYTPGTKIKIIPEKKSRKLKPNYYLVLPWHFRKEILIREKKTILNGSKFIFPLPNFKVYG